MGRFVHTKARTAGAMFPWEGSMNEPIARACRLASSDLTFARDMGLVDEMVCDGISFACTISGAT